MVKLEVKKDSGDIPGGPVVGTLPSGAGGAGSIPCQGAGIPHNSWSNPPPPNKNHRAKALL